MANIPEIRFNEFSDEWEEKKLSQITEQYNEPVETPTNGYERLGIRSHAKGTFHEYVPAGQELETAQMSRVRKNKLIFNITFAWEHAVAITNNDDDGKLVSHRFPQFTLSNEIFTDFFKYAILDKKFRHKLWLSSPGGAGRNRVLNIKEAFEYVTKYPKSINEQKLIGKFFNNISTLISSTQEKLDKAIILKKSMLEKMFPKDGAKTPELRFSGFNGDWEENKFSKITYPSGEKNIDNLPLQSYSITNENGFIPQNEQFENGGNMFTADKTMYWIVTPKSFAYNPARINVGSIGYYDGNENVIVSSLYEIFKIDDCCDSSFLTYWFKTNTFQKLIERLQEGGVRLYFYYDKLCMGTILLPTLQEQQKIGQFFVQLDKTISSYKDELEKLKIVKKSLLEKMFI